MFKCNSNLKKLRNFTLKYFSCNEKNELNTKNRKLIPFDEYLQYILHVMLVCVVLQLILL